MSGGAGRAEVGRFLVSRPRGAAARWLFEHLFAPHGRGERWLGWLARRGGAGRRLLSRPVDGAGGPAARLLDDTVGDDWVLCRPRADDARGRSIAFAFAGGETPTRAVKLRRVGSGGATLVSEAATLERLAAELPPALASTVPAVLDRAEATVAGQRWETLALTPLAGRSAYVELLTAFRPQRLVERHLGAAGDWLLAFQRATADGGMVAAHGDFWLRNLLLAGGSPAVVDWEAARPTAASPFDDLFHFAVTYARSYPWGGRRRPAEEALRRGLYRDRLLVAAVRRQVGRLAAAHGVEPAELAACFAAWAACRAARGAEWAVLGRLVEQEVPCAFSG